MTVTLEDYWRAVDAFVAGLSGLGDDLVSIFLSGSLARGEAVPGQSDLLDAVVVVRRGLLDERNGFLRVVEQILAACEPVARSGLPFAHPPFLYAEEDLGDLGDLYRQTLASPRSSRVLYGEDVRPALCADAEAQAVAGCALFAMQRRYMHPFAIFLGSTKLGEREQGALFQLLVQMRNHLPVAACAALGMTSNQVEALGELRRACPDLDLGVFDEIGAIRRGERALGGLEELQSLLRRVFETAERLEQRILSAGVAPWSGLVAADTSPP